MLLSDGGQETCWGWNNFHATMGKKHPTKLDRKNVRCLDCYNKDIRAGKVPAGYVPQPEDEPETEGSAEAEGNDAWQ